MNKKWIAALALMMILALVCTACGGKKDDAAVQVSSTMAPAEATELPAVTAPPASSSSYSADSGSGDMLVADSNCAPSAPKYVDRDAWLASLSEEQRKAEELAGSPVEELYEAIGAPVSVTYSASCMVADGEDGILSYDGFDVATIRYANGTEFVMGTN